ncbi:hypothetical protein HID58_012760, partial [Brassica napus]
TKTSEASALAIIEFPCPQASTIMARRYTRSDKEKWVAKPSPPPKKSPIRIPASNNEALIAQNKLTLIGRVTNTRFQRPRAVAHIELPSGEITEVEFEYVKIEKHCFTCFSLLHEEEDCPKRAPGDPPAKERKLGITQAMALERIEAGKRRHDENRGYKPPSQRALPVYNERKSASRNDHSADVNERNTASRNEHHSSTYRGSMDYARRPPSSNSHRSEGQRDVPSYRPRRSDDITNRYGLTVSGSYNSHHQRPPRDTPVKYGPSPLDGRSGNDQVRPNASASSHTPPPVPIRERMEPPAGNSSPLESCKSRERRSALLRLAAPDLRDQLPRRSPISKQSGRLQDVEIISGDTPIQARRDATNEVLISPLITNDSAPEQNWAPASQRLGGLASLGLILLQYMNLQLLLQQNAGQQETLLTKGSLGAHFQVNALKPNPPPRKRICTEKGRSLPWNKAGPNNIKVEILESSENIIDTKVAFKGSSSFISFIYGAPSVENRAAHGAQPQARAA